jgi:hypothetical protein
VRRPRSLDLLLVAVAAVMVVATARVVANNYHLRGREPADRLAFNATAPRIAGGGHFVDVKVNRALPGMDVICGTRVAGGRTSFRLCLLVRHRGPVRARTVGGYREPATGFEEEVVHTRCFGRARAFHLCKRAKRHAT